MQRISLVGLVALAVGTGALWGTRSLPPSETEIIDRAAAAYVAETGGVLTDCAARPTALEGVHLVVSCAEGSWVMAYDAQGRAVDSGALAEREAPGT